jgi:hypothetical protein
MMQNKYILPPLLVFFFTNNGSIPRPPSWSKYVNKKRS